MSSCDVMVSTVRNPVYMSITCLNSLTSLISIALSLHIIFKHLPKHGFHTSARIVLTYMCITCILFNATGFGILTFHFFHIWNHYSDNNTCEFLFRNDTCSKPRFFMMLFLHMFCTSIMILVSERIVAAAIRQKKKRIGRIIMVALIIIIKMIICWGTVLWISMQSSPDQLIPQCLVIPERHKLSFPPLTTSAFVFDLIVIVVFYIFKNCHKPKVRVGDLLSRYHQKENEFMNKVISPCVVIIFVSVSLYFLTNVLLQQARELLFTKYGPVMIFMWPSVTAVQMFALQRILSSWIRERILMTRSLVNEQAGDARSNTGLHFASLYAQWKSTSTENTTPTKETIVDVEKKEFNSISGSK